MPKPRFQNHESAIHYYAVCIKDRKEKLWKDHGDLLDFIYELRWHANKLKEQEEK